MCVRFVTLRDCALSRLANYRYASLGYRIRLGATHTNRPLFALSLLTLYAWRAYVSAKKPVCPRVLDEALAPVWRTCGRVSARVRGGTELQWRKELSCVSTSTIATLRLLALG